MPIGHNDMTMKQHIIISVLAAMTLGLLASCSEGESYTDRLNAERNACNAYLAQKRVINDIPTDSVFEVGEDAPFYRIDQDGNVYMQVLRTGDRKNDRAKEGETIYFRFTRSDIEAWYSTGTLDLSYSNEIDMSESPTSFKYKDYSLATSSQWGYGLQLPLDFLGVECEVNLLIKSIYGRTSEISYVTPYLYHVRYFHSRI